MQKLQKGSKGKNVTLLKHYLNKVVRPSPGLNEADNKFGQDTESAVITFKTVQALAPVDGVVDAKTWGEIGRMLGYQVWQEDALATLPQWLVSISTGVPMVDGPLDIDRSVFFQLFMEHFGPLSESQLHGLDALLEFIDRDPAITDVRWAAYLLATVKWECANTWQPIEEFGKGAKHSYGKEVTVTGSDGKKYKNRYYGRGYVQLTHEDNYRTMSQELNMGDELLIHPERVLKPAIAYKVISLGMTTGKSFANGHKFADYSTGKKKMDYVGARHMVNGIDHNHDIAEIAKQLETMLMAAKF
jgi:putative chitinase